MTPDQAIKTFLKDAQPDSRYSSFDYCYNYFRGLPQNTVSEDLEKACSILGFYLASWGMMRGSSFLLQKSSRYQIPLVRFLNSLDKEIWDIVPADYVTRQSEILEIYNSVRDLIIEDGNSEVILVTKIMLGTLGIAPAYDTYFCKYFKTVDPERSKFWGFTLDSLEVLHDYYLDNKPLVDGYSSTIFTKDFVTSSDRFNYPRAKIIDMIGFTMGMAMP